MLLVVGLRAKALSLWGCAMPEIIFIPLFAESHLPIPIPIFAILFRIRKQYIRKTPRDKRGVFLHRSNLDLADVERVRAFRAVPDLERDLVALLKLIERNVPELVGVEEKILRAFRRAAHLDEAETFFVLLDAYSIFP